MNRRMLAVHSVVSLLCLCFLTTALLTGQVRENHAIPSLGTTAEIARTSGGMAPEVGGGYVIGTDDVLSINVWRETEISRVIPVRSDGKISLPLAGEVQAGGRTPQELEQEIATRLQAYISEPDVTVIVQEMHSRRFNVLGQVLRPGSYTLTQPTRVLDAIAMAGGFRDFAKQKSIYVLRQNADGSSTRLPFNYKDVMKGKNQDQNVSLQARDTVYVP